MELSNPMGDLSLLIREATPADLAAIVDYAYFGATEVKSEDVSRFLRLARSLEIKGLKEIEWVSKKKPTEIKILSKKASSVLVKKQVPPKVIQIKSDVAVDEPMEDPLPEGENSMELSLDVRDSEMDVSEINVELANLPIKPERTSSAFSDAKMTPEPKPLLPPELGDGDRP